MVAKLEFVDDFRQRWANRRQLAVEIIAKTLEGERIELLLEKLKRETVYDRLSISDQQNFRRFCSDMRTITRGWFELHEYEREWFLQGRVVYSTLANRVREQTS